MAWYKVTLSHEDIAARKHIALQDAFTKFFTAFCAPTDAGMFGSPESGIHEYYFSPGAARIAMPLIASYFGVQCSAPKRSEVHLLVSHANPDGVAFRPEN